MEASIICLSCCWSSYFPSNLYNFMVFSIHMCSYKALLLNNWSTPIITMCYFFHYDCNNPLRMTHWCSNESMSRILSISLVNTRDLAHCAVWALLPYVWKQIYSFPGGGIVFTSVCKFLLNYFCISIDWVLVEVTLWLFLLCVTKLFSIIINSNVWNCILFFFNCLHIIFHCFRQVSRLQQKWY